MQADSESASSLPAILAVDDQPLQLRVVTALLAKHYQVYTAQSGIEAIRLLENMAVGGQLNRLQAILLDVTMPELNGLAILELIRARYPRMPIIICSAHQERSVILNARQRGASDYLLKPYTSEVLLQKLSKHISQTTNG